MISTIITAVVMGLGATLLEYWAKKAAQKDHDDSNAKSGFIVESAESKIEEKEITDAAKKAKDTSSSDFSNLR